MACVRIAILVDEGNRYLHYVARIPEGRLGENQARELRGHIWL
jgi:hypothetical protein